LGRRSKSRKQECTPRRSALALRDLPTLTEEFFGEPPNAIALCVSEGGVDEHPDL